MRTAITVAVFLACAGSGFAQNRPARDSVAYFEFQVDKTATPLVGNKAPVYPQKLREANVTGEVLVQYVVDTLGRPMMGSFRVLRSTDPLFSAAVKEAVTELRYAPAEVGGRKVKQLVQQPFNFALSKSRN